MRAMKNIVILISGRGSNMEAVVRAAQSEGWPARIAAVISNRPDAVGLAFAQERGIATAVVPSIQFADRAAFDAALQQAGRVSRDDDWCPTKPRPPIPHAEIGNSVAGRASLDDD